MAIATYLVVGCLINAFARHKQGVEIIPNVEFWKDFPFLLKVCTLYLLCVCVCVCVCACVRACVRA